MRRFAVIDKRVGETPLMALQKWRSREGVSTDIPASYAGRLDPMASGMLLILLGDECKRQTEYTDLDKEYEIEVLLDIGSDTGDVLGLTELIDRESRPDRSSLLAALSRERGAHMRAYPAFSSKTVGGTPLFLHALQKSLSPDDIPTHQERIFSISLREHSTLSTDALSAWVSGLLSLAPRSTEPSKELGKDFRIDAVRAGWQETLRRASERSFGVYRLRVTCASGVYMRSLVGRIGASLGTRALALSIRRTKIGRYIPVGKTGFWLSSFTYCRE